MSRRNPTKARLLNGGWIYEETLASFFLTAKTIHRIVFDAPAPAVMPSTFIFTGSNAESMKGGMLMKSKHCTYGKETTFCSFDSYHFDDNFFHKSTIAALLAQGRLLLI